MQIVRERAATTKVTSIGWPLLTFLATAFVLGTTFWFASEGDVRGFFRGLKPQDWATVLSGVFAALAFSGLLVSLIYQRSEIVNMQQQIFDQTAALARHAFALEAQAHEVRAQTEAVSRQVTYYQKALALQQAADVDAQISDMEAVLEQKLQDFMQKLKVQYKGSATKYLLDRSDAPSWLAHGLHAASLMSQPRENGRTNSDVEIIFNTILNRCRAIRSAVEFAGNESPRLRERMKTKLRDSSINRIEAIFDTARQIVNRQLI